jgi:uncharacterized UBP type Zn finger protein
MAYVNGRYILDHAGQAVEEMRNKAQSAMNTLKQNITDPDVQKSFKQAAGFTRKAITPSIGGTATKAIGKVFKKIQLK